MLLGIQYGSRRFTRDIDFSTPTLFANVDEGSLRSEIDRALAETVEALNYQLDCRIQAWRIQPSRKGTFPTLHATIGYAVIGTPEHRRLQKGQAPEALPLDYSFNETAPFVDMLACDDGKGVRTYGLTTLVAEKYRAVLQQPERDRSRGQDVYDLHHLLNEENGLREINRAELLQTIIEKSASRNVLVNRESLRMPEVMERTRAPYQSLAADVTDLPDFATAYADVRTFYESLPWK